MWFGSRHRRGFLPQQLESHAKIAGWRKPRRRWLAADCEIVRELEPLLAIFRSVAGFGDQLPSGKIGRPLEGRNLREKSA